MGPAACIWDTGDGWYGPGGEYPSCPDRLTETAEAHVLAKWLRWSRVSPLVGWVDAFAVWEVEGLTELQAALGERRAQEAERDLEMIRQGR